MDPLPKSDMHRLSDERRAELIQQREERGAELLAGGDDHLSDADLDEIRKINNELEELHSTKKRPHPGHPGGKAAMVGGSGFAAAIIKAGWDQKTRPHVKLPVGAGVFHPPVMAAITVSGSLDDVSPRRLSPSVLTEDTRFLYPALKIISVAATDTSVTFLKQTARALADPDDMERALDAVTNKPESTFTAGIEIESLKQWAHVIKSVPNIVARQAMFRQLIDNEMRLGLSLALDDHVWDAIMAASLAIASAGSSLAESIRKAMTTVQNAGYNPDTVALPPGYAETLDILSLTLNNSLGATPLFGLRPRLTKSVGIPVVFDSSEFATLYIGPSEFQSFEENDGRTNSQLYRAEVNALVVVDRPDAACEVWPS